MREILETWIRSLGQKSPLEEGMANPSSILAWKIPWREEPRGLQSRGLQKESNVTEHTHTQHPINNIENESMVARGERQRSLAGYSPYNHRVKHDWVTEHFQ